MTDNMEFPDTAKCIIRTASSDLGKEELVRKVTELNRNGRVIQLFDPKQIRSRMHLLGAYLNAVAAFDEKRNTAKSMATEMLLFAGMTCQINDAIKRMGIKSTKGFLVFADSERSYSLASGLFKNVKEFKSGKADIAILQKMAVARLGD